MSAPVSAAAAPPVAWYAKPVEETATTIGVAVDTGLSGADAAARLAKDGPNARAVEKPPPGWQVKLPSGLESLLRVVPLPMLMPFDGGCPWRLPSG